MEKIKIGNKIFELITNGVTQYEDKLTLNFKVGDFDLVSLEKLMEDKANVKKIEMLDETNEPIQFFYNYVNLREIMKIKSYSISEEEVTDIFSITLEKDKIEHEVAQNTANIAYIAMMSSIDLGV